MVHSLQLGVDDWLRAGLDAGDVVAHRVQAGLGGVDPDDLLKRGLAARELVLPVDALGLALLKQQGLGVLALLEHLVNVRWLVDVWLVALFSDPPARGN